MSFRLVVRALVLFIILVPGFSRPARAAIVNPEICDNCVDDDGNTLVDREDPMCTAPADGSGAGISDQSEAKTAIKCQTTIQKASLGFAVTKAAKLTKCVSLAFACVQLHNGDQSCLDKAKTSCDKLMLDILKAETKAKQAIVKTCSDNGTVDTSEISDATGLGFGAEVGLLDCPGVANGSDLADCVVDRQECGVERLVVMLAPRAQELMVAAGQNVAGNFPCMVNASATRGTDAGGTGISDPIQAKAAVTCQATLSKVGVKLGKLLGSSIVKCIDAGESCIQLKHGDNACETKAMQACGKIVAKLGGANGTLNKTVLAALKKCETADVPLTNLNAAAGLGFVAVSDPGKRCSQFSVADIDPTRSLLRCVGDQFACEGRYMVERQTPRLSELATMLGFPLDTLSIPF